MKLDARNSCSGTGFGCLSAGVLSPSEVFLTNLCAGLLLKGAVGCIETVVSAI